MTMTRAAMSTYAIIQDESLTVNRQKLLLTLGIPSKHPGRALRHSDATVLDMRVADSNTKDDVKDAIERAAAKQGTALSMESPTEVTI